MVFIVFIQVSLDGCVNFVPNFRNVFPVIFPKAVCFRNRCFKIAHKFSIGFRSGLYACHFSTFHSFFWKNLPIIFDLFTGALSCWKIMSIKQIFFRSFLKFPYNRECLNSLYIFGPSYCIAPQHIADRVSVFNFFCLFWNLAPFLWKTLTISSLEMRTLVSLVKTTFCLKKKHIDTPFWMKTLAFLLLTDCFAVFFEKTLYFSRICLTLSLEIVSY